MSKQPCLVYSPQFFNYNFGAQHPFNPIRLKLTVDMMDAFKLFRPVSTIAPQEVPLDVLQQVHDTYYIAAVQRAGETAKACQEDIRYYDLGTEDNPVFSNMHQASALLAGATLTGARQIAAGKADHVLNFAGGLHHAQRAKASGFCIYNDLAVAITYLRQQGMRVAYVDLDAHHGDGVQWLFYDDPEVLTVSFHESGRFLFPGTGTVYERGSRAGFGYSVNLSLEPFTEDLSAIEVFDAVMPPLLDKFQPDIIVSQHGCDGHEYDPLAHLSFTTAFYSHTAKGLHGFAHTHCRGRWLATGGGGYDFWRVVPRVWTALWAEMLEAELPAAVPNAWVDKYRQHAPVELPEQMADPPGLFPPKPRRKEISEKNRLTMEKVMNWKFLLKGDPEQARLAE